MIALLCQALLPENFKIEEIFNHGGHIEPSVRRGFMLRFASSTFVSFVPFVVRILVTVHQHNP
jgi:hypothetical protein